ncbi:interactor of constitutive active ROPs 4 [Manihot esculenta]|uniref:Interactor of constitutive active ROPs 4 n=3 Tax=Manihot esculenta TaxID=3983 RepID=A0A251JL84_MANES|nr:interactor of constitutive active ROPs 4 [Manihot esculenta]XP_021594028.1 interactor of constitutive active ROPs 4 [Manihot esculenta]XP_021594029.1 interactor of constitutive active ROPs 4 [Manihot esculenta]XP_043806762.1 interactor of constitutive active ROPs 4 [Manihot esculenta]KAG8637279.1 hypothetical protein MANES_15G101600v8 [Manihot esculenta]KAG8637280.1 hypothetical protein MANES_15G101600v8 [Manihot esculenta]OAY28883.1 hypothetical protein MANES_15G101600v8 [Manihot esculent
MPRSRGLEMPQRQSPRAPHPLRTSSSESDPLNHRPITERSPKLGDRRSPRGPPSDSLNQKKLGTRIADLESQLGQAQEELKILKGQLASAEAAKQEAQQELENKTKKPTILEPDEIQEKHPPAEIQDSEKADDNVIDANNQQETDVFEVPFEKEAADTKVEPGHLLDHEEKGNGATKIITETLSISEPVKPSFNDLALKDDEINMLKAKLEKKQNELEAFVKENENLKNLLNGATSNISSAKAKEEEMSMRLSQLGEELEQSKANEAHLKEKLESAEGAKATMEAEIKKMRVQTEQWRKAADAAAAVLAGAVEMNGRITERCGSMDKHFSGVFGTTGGGGGYTGLLGSPGISDDLGDGFGSGKRKGSGIKMFGDLWKKKSQK